MRTASVSNYDEYLGEEIIQMDDLRGMATASDWLTNGPERAGTASARYRIEESHRGFLLVIQRKLRRISSIH